MRKPVSKHALRRALEQAREEGLVTWTEPAGTVVDHVWHAITKEALDGKPERAPARRREPAVA